MSLPNSNMNCRQAPHGNTNLFPFAAMAIAVNFLSPSETALENATRSAQILREYEAFSTFVPVYILLVFVNKAAPTAKREYGEYEFFFARIDFSIRIEYFECNIIKILLLIIYSFLSILEINLFFSIQDLNEAKSNLPCL